MRRRATQRDIADYLGVGQKTVSRVLRGEGYASERTRDKVLSAARRLGYRTNVSARTMRTGRAGTVALLQDTSTRGSNLPQVLLRGIQEALVDRGMHLLIERVPDAEVLRAGGVPEVMREWMVDGLLVNHNAGMPPGMVTAVHEDSVPAVWINSKQSSDCVRPDDREAAFRATTLLTEAGHRRIAFVDYAHGHRRRHEHYSGVDRRSGYAAAAKAAGIPARVIGADGMVERPQRVAFSSSWLAREDRPTAVLTLSRSTAVPVYIAARLAGLDVPGDMSIVTIDDVHDDYVGASIACMVLPWYRIGLEAVEMLLEKIEHPRRKAQPCAVQLQWCPGDTFGPRGG